MAEKGSKTILHRGFTESIKNIGLLKTIKLTENTDIRKTMAIHWREASDGQEHWLINALRVAKIRSNLNTGRYASGVPSDHSERDRRWWSHCMSLLLGVAWNVNEFLCKTAQEGGSGLAVHWQYTVTSGFNCNWLKIIIVKKVIVFPAFVSFSISCYTAWYSGTGG